jgi:DNA-binding transcriptional LysR family regulator
MPWEFLVGGEIVGRDVASVFMTNDVELEANAVAAGQCVGQLVGATAAPLIRSGALVPLLIEHVAEHLGLYLYYGSRVAQPARVRAFIDLTVERVAGNTAWVLSRQELAAAARKHRR